VSADATPTGIRRRPAESGAALLFALFALLLLGLSLALLTLTMRLRFEEQQRSLRRARLDLLLDGAMAETMGRLALDPRFAGVAPRPAGMGEAWSDVERVSPTERRVEVVAKLGGRQVSARARVRVVPGPPRVVRWERGGAGHR
jgi:hypothetical protein